ncbi:amidase domain-containing protein [Bacillus sp. DTU_2020_1000418_1_SI_GHA_SEK_038]|uniref:amidase domain-containing protein n=1 Tax=Bacillus sp. DTU_2020_1000418_1_SI_GHA_SEK_038 TaxID=3077585 RepID=UPI0028E8C55E|nr:amidase domain-containing protein [Bacillus sp. DTU_2020_1000418_1_SI_GHA_SEK_038]WNS76681.1 amidase domain-containing protein [Bacillus sp. DTU_2020_1000418_1_SI_GHA_SEK_038]
MREQLQELLEKRVQQCVSQKNRSSTHFCPKIELKKEGLAKRSGEIIKAKSIGNIISVDHGQEEKSSVQYNVHFKYLVKHKDMLFLEEQIEERRAEFYKGILIEDHEINRYAEPKEDTELKIEKEDSEERIVYEYNRLRAVQYAERWWNSYNPAYETFEVNCTNYISQCLHAGGGPMRGYPNRGAGWWMMNKNWSYSWSVANSMRIHLPRASIGLRAKEVTSPEELMLGDVICYDFQGDGRFDHTTIVTAKDANGMPLVNAHTTNSRMRYWAYEDSTAYTPNIKYKFFTIVDDQ